MIKVDLITGFLGAGKTTFIKKYVSYLKSKGMRVGILENDHGAVNVDMLLLNSLRDDNCELEMVAGGCDMDCHRRRFKTKLISMAMSGYDRIVIEPSGIFDTDEFFDALRDDPLDNWYEIGNVFCIVRAEAEKLSDEAGFLLAGQLANAGRIILSFIRDERADAAAAVEYINGILKKTGCHIDVTKDEIFAKKWDEMNESDFEVLLKAGYKIRDCAKKYDLEELGFETLYYLNLELDIEQLKEKTKQLFESDVESIGKVFRVKGFSQKAEQWYELNANSEVINVTEIEAGQNVLIIIGENLNRAAINSVIGAVTAEEMD